MDDLIEIILSSDVISTSSISISIIGGVLYLFRNWFTVRLTESIRHEYDVKLANIESQLQEKQNEIDSIVRITSGNILNHNEEIIKRKLQAINNLWGCFIDIKKYITPVYLMERLNIDECFKYKNREFFEAYFKPFNIKIEDFKNKEINISFEKAQKEEIWLNPIIWALYSAYITIVLHSYIIIDCLQKQIDIGDYMRDGHIQEILKTALPNANFSETKDHQLCHHYIIVHLEERLTEEIRLMISGKESDKETTERAAHIMENINQLIKNPKDKMQ